MLDQDPTTGEAVTETLNVLICGGGPAGLVMALDLAGRGIATTVVEPRRQVDHTRPRAKTTNARTMTQLRRLGLADKVRAAGLPVDYSQQVTFCTSLTGYSLREFPGAFQLQRGRYDLQPECGQQVAQPALEDVLREAAAENPLIDLRLGVTATPVTLSPADAAETPSVVRLSADDGTSHLVEASWLAGADGGSSAVRKALGYAFEGRSAPHANLNLLFTSDDLAEKVKLDPAVQYWVVSAEAAGMIGRADLKNTWWVILQGVDLTGAHANPEAAVRAMVGADIDVNVIAQDDWTARMLLSEHYGRGSVHLIGDAAHMNPPWGGHGFNTCVGDAVNLAWKLAAKINGWAGSDLLASYEAERRPIAARTIAEAATNGKALAYDFLDPDLASESEAGEAARARAFEALVVKRSEFHSLGLVLGYDYEGTPLVDAGDGSEPFRDPIEYRPSARPGRLLPHAWLNDAVSVYDVLGPGFTLLVDVARVGSDLDSWKRVAAQAPAGVPFVVVPVDTPDATDDWDTAAVLVRPDQHVAWRGDDPAAVAAALDRAAGHAHTNSVAA
jgi:2-polyprenyl-6-methoxyphenol hydroxylase-like FAD-dependent oxidoreductase